MAITVYGVTGSMDTLHFNRQQQDLGEAGAGMSVPVGFDVSLVSGLTLNVSSAGGTARAMQAGTIALMDADQQKTLGARSTTGTRIDTICLQIDLSLGLTTAGSIVVVPGTPGLNTPAALTQSILVSAKWQTPLARVTVPPSGALTIVDVRPGGTLTGTEVTIPGNFLRDAAQPLTIRRTGRQVELQGSFVRSVSDITVGSSAINDAVVIPSGFRPAAETFLQCVSNVVTAPRFHPIRIRPAGEMSLWAGTGTIASGDNLRMINAIWLTKEN